MSSNYAKKVNSHSQAKHANEDNSRKLQDFIYIFKTILKLHFNMLYADNARFVKLPPKKYLLIEKKKLISRRTKNTDGQRGMAQKHLSEFFHL